ncbi:tRNA pseudouridine(38-40) synthase TruA [Paramaledivibacter caminithermalis]|jgi:tRNA pseudouridine38-40 synthase|uniref:tRNA pseudouridine synthase A n=1 Tax=Paramaledivibacter caminithermalis (strain DSM 15212 / CIP 107654 / DViRD3) TaxID=1121301 RepID=A0A1M6RSI2_PARC5|nr:tRNA pseudouridine(38-40) synthase TruA [Paramaledivibacter caminithermalis]SHK35390.1 tRNA pseudouridine38-40 synthase [Paramaledivibacter caminithermalis DSM 15212]
MKNVKLTIAYDGTNYSGWQRQNNARTIQYEIEKALKKILKKDIAIHGSGRTDAGVHALGQAASFIEDFTLPTHKIPVVINNVLPKDIVINSAEEMDMDFHARYCAKGKKYIYKIYNDSIRNPIYRNYSWFINEDINLKKIIEASKYFIGQHDFKSFMAAGSNIKDTIRTIYSINIYRKDKFIIIEYEGNGFLYKMVRIITATLIDINFNKISIKDLEDIIKSKDRSKAGPTAPAQGLYLAEVYY